MDSKLKDAYRYWKPRCEPGHARTQKVAQIAFDLARMDVAAYRAAVDAGDTKTAVRFKRYPPTPPCLSWQSRDESSPARRREKLGHVDKPEAFGLRLVGRVIPESYGGRNSWDKRGDRGWHTDPHGDVFKDGTGLCYGVVYQLPGRHGRARFVAGYEFGGFDGGPTLDFGTIYESESAFQGDAWNTDPMEREDALDAARAADSMAQHAAEREREYQEASQAGYRFAELGENIARDRAQALALIREIKETRAAGIEAESISTICATLRATISRLRRDIQAAREKRESLKAEWLQSWRGETAATFKESAGL